MNRQLSGKNPARCGGPAEWVAHPEWDLWRVLFAKFKKKKKKSQVGHLHTWLVCTSYGHLNKQQQNNQQQKCPDKMAASRLHFACVQTVKTRTLPSPYWRSRWAEGTSSLPLKTTHAIMSWRKSLQLKRKAARARPSGQTARGSATSRNTSH